MSAKLLMDPKKPNDFVDDIESAYHVLIWSLLRYSKHSLSNRDVTILLLSFDETVVTQEGVVGGERKKGHFTSRDIPKLLKFKDNESLNELIRELTVTLAVRYEEPPTEEEIREA